MPHLFMFMAAILNFKMVTRNFFSLLVFTYLSNDITNLCLSTILNKKIPQAQGPPLKTPHYFAFLSIRSYCSLLYLRNFIIKSSMSFSDVPSSTTVSKKYNKLILQCFQRKIFLGLLGQHCCRQAE